MKAKLIVCLLVLLGWSAMAQVSTTPPGVVVSHFKKSTKCFIGSPSLVILPNGDYVASHDQFGDEDVSHWTSWAYSYIYRSTDKGKTWTKVSRLKGMFWGNLFCHEGDLYIMGTTRGNGNFVIRRSTDGGVTWSMPYSKETGLLLEGEYHTAPQPLLHYNGRYWRPVEYVTAETRDWGKCFSTMILSIPDDADLMNADNWTASNRIPYDSTYLKGTFDGWLEGCPVVTPEGKLNIMLRVETLERVPDVAAFVEVSEGGRKVSFDPETGFRPFPGGGKKFTIRYDEKSKRYWSIVNYNKTEYLTNPKYKHIKPSNIRNVISLVSSPDLKEWTVHQHLLEHPELDYHGFQYVDWQVDGEDMVYLVRLAYDDEEGGAENFHNSNYMTFHRLPNFRSYEQKRVE